MSRATLSEFADKVTEIMPVIAREFMKEGTGELRKARVTLPQFVVLNILETHRRPSRMTDLAHFMNVTTAAMTGIIERLVRDGYAARSSDPKDRRTINVNITPKGARVVKKVTDKRKKMIARIFGMITKAERDTYLKILTHLREHLTAQER